MNQDRLIDRRTVLAGIAVTLALPVLQIRADDDAPGSDAVPPGPKPDADGWVKTVAAKDLAGKNFDDQFAKSNKLMLARDGKKIYAYSSVCTHKGCIVAPTDQPTLLCPCHHAQFNIDGTVKPNMKARRDLPRYALRLAADGTIEVNVSKPVDAKDASATLQTESAS
jgi:Rieske Fe-S protein